ncbi:MAG: ROK family protein [Chloroflexi bacterium]|nr:ROK family protein [Chloroflexota bacterium]
MSSSSNRVSAKYVLAGDIGGTHMRAAMANREGTLLERAVCATEPEKGLPDAEGRLAALLEDVASSVPREDIGGVVLSSAGPIVPDTGIYEYPPNLPGWHGLTMKPGLAASLNLPVAIGHDATLGALAESRYGVGKGARHLVYVTVSTGVGGGIIANGQMVTGGHGHAGEIGHLLVRPGGQSCNVGCDGCLEGIASGTGIARSAQAQMDAGRSTAMLGKAGGDVRAVTAQTVFEAAAEGDELAIEIVDGVIDAVAVGFANILNTLDPEYLVVGGGVTTSLQPYWDDLAARIEDKALPHFAGHVPLHVSPLGDDVSLVGAAALAFDYADATAEKD